MQPTPAHQTEAPPEKKQMTRTQLYVLLAILSVAVIGLAGYIIWESNQTDDVSQSTASESNQMEEVTNSETENNSQDDNQERESNQEADTDADENWATYSGKYGLTFRYPNDWSVVSETVPNSMTDETQVRVINENGLSILKIIQDDTAAPAMSGELVSLEPLDSMEVDGDTLYKYDCSSTRSTYEPDICFCLYETNLSVTPKDSTLTTVMINTSGEVAYSIMYGAISSDDPFDPISEDLTTVENILGTVTNLRNPAN